MKLLLVLTFIFGIEYQKTNSEVNVEYTLHTVSDNLSCDLNNVDNHAIDKIYKSNNLRTESNNQSSPIYLEFVVIGDSFGCVGYCPQGMLCCEVRIIRNPDFENNN